MDGVIRADEPASQLQGSKILWQCQKRSVLGRRGQVSAIAGIIWQQDHGMHPSTLKTSDSHKCVCGRLKLNHMLVRAFIFAWLLAGSWVIAVAAG